MSKRFFIYDNGKSVFNIDNIVRIYVVPGFHDGQGKRIKPEYKVVVVGLLVYDIKRDEYNKLIDFIKEMDNA